LKIGKDLWCSLCLIDDGARSKSREKPSRIVGGECPIVRVFERDIGILGKEGLD